MAFERRQPSVDLRAFLDPLKPGRYFDCGRARLYGIDEALEAEALRRGRAVGDDEFQLVATDGGLIFCRASIMFAIAARWKDLSIGRPEDGNRPGEVLLPINWPTHGDLQFTVSRRLGSNIFRRWLQLQAQATRRSQVEQDVRFEYSTAPGGAAQANGQAHPRARSDSPPVAIENVDLRCEDDDGETPHRNQAPTGADHEAPTGADHEAPTGADHVHRNGSGSVSARPVVDPLATIDAAVVDEWVDDRVPHGSDPEPVTPTSPDRPTAPRQGPIAAFFDGEATADPFNGREPGSDEGEGLSGRGGGSGDAIRFEVRPAVGESEFSEPDDKHATATQFMPRTVDGTDIFPDGDGGGPVDVFGRSIDRSSRGERGASGKGRRHRNGHVSVPVPEISGARLQVTESSGPDAEPRLDIRSTLLAGGRESAWIEVLRRRQVLILGLATILALALIALIGFLAGDGDGGEETVADVPLSADAGAETGSATVDNGVGAGGQAADGSLTTVTVPAGGESDPATIDPTASTLRVSSTSVQICHSNYGGCVPVAADVDCDGDGDGPAFQATPVAVFGDDVYELDTDGDREACEPDQPRLGAAGGDG